MIMAYSFAGTTMTVLVSGEETWRAFAALQMAALRSCFAPGDHDEFCQRNCAPSDSGPR
jgi:hypothetical protein